MNAYYRRLVLVLFGAMGLTAMISSCGNDDEQEDRPAEPTQGTTKVVTPDFNADSAYAYIAQQVSYGPRVPGTPAQKMCAAWMEQKLKAFCDTVYKQSTQVKAGDGKVLPCINLIGSINPSAGRRVLLLAHWDSRPWGDMDTKDQDKPIIAADDGGSGVAVLLELARQLQTKPLPEGLGVDILLTDVEDYGKNEWGDDSYALGTQYWARQPHVPGYKAEFGILLDMVGARDAKFPLEGISTRYAGGVQQRIWEAASALGYSSFFPFVAGVEITDDHVFVNEIIRIPTVDIINLNSKTQSAFAPHWHTHDDNMSIIDKNTLKAVGQTLLRVLYDMSQPS
jgi:glutaminyl-peptide cyclotransferase